MIEYGLGQSPTSMSFLQKMNPPIPCPVGSLREWGLIYTNADGTTTGDGSPLEIWTWAILTPYEVVKLRSMVGLEFGNSSKEIYIRTKVYGEVFQTFKSIMIWPNDINSRRDLVGNYRDVSIEFRKLEVV